MTGSADPASFRLAHVPGVTPDKWVRVWTERLPGVPLLLRQIPAAGAGDVLLADEADAGLLRLPVDRSVLSAIPLYTETTVVVVPKDHVVTAADEVTVHDLGDDIVLHPLDDVLGWERVPGRPALKRPATTKDAVELVAAGIGVLVVPLSLARLHHRKDLTYRPVTDAPRSSVALSWPEDAHTDLVEEFIGIVRGRTVNSTRGRRPAPAPAKGERTGAAPARRTPFTGNPASGRTASSKAGKAGSGTAGSGKAAGRGARRGSGAASRGGRRGGPRR